MVGSSDVVSDFMRLLKPYTILDLSRSGQIAVARAES
jgi:acetolactate synthase small subunit